MSADMLCITRWLPLVFKTMVSIPFSFEVSGKLMMGCTEGLLSLFSIVTKSSRDSMQVKSGPDFSRSCMRPSFSGLTGTEGSLTGYSFSIPLVASIPMPP